jgi:hypothetical protein
MFTKAGAIQYGKRVGVRFYLKNDRGGLYGGYKTREQAEDAKRAREAEDRRNPWTKGKTKFIITEAER